MKNQTLGADISALDHKLETDVCEEDVRVAGEIAAPPVTVADPVPPLATPPAAPINPPVCLPIFFVTTRPELQLGHGVYIRRSSPVMSVLSQKRARKIPNSSRYRGTFTGVI